MSVRSMLKHTCSTARNQTVGTNGRKQYSTNLASVPCLFTPMSDYATIQNGYSVGSAWTVYFADGTDINVTDKVTWNGKTYLVRGRKPYTGFGATSYLQVSAETEQANG